MFFYLSTNDSPNTNLLKLLNRNTALTQAQSEIILSSRASLKGELNTFQFNLNYQMIFALMTLGPDKELSIVFVTNNAY